MHSPSRPRPPEPAAPRRRRAVAILLGIVLASVVFPALAAWAQNVDQRVVNVGGAQRYYLLHVPPGIPNPAAVVLVFHGGGGRPDGIMRNTGFNEIADQNGFIVVYPAGTAQPSGRGGTWNIGGPQTVTSADDVDFVRAILRDLAAVVPIDRTRIYATGISMGGVFSYRLACEMSDTFAAVAPVAATMVEPSCQPRSPVAVLHIHGSADDRIPIAGGEGMMTASGRTWPAPQQAISFWAQVDACTGPGSSVAQGPATTCSTFGRCRATVEYCVVAGGAHSWPGGEGRLSQSSASFPASETIWQFFAANPKHSG
jgi:polyhydroxybutyrate depolymerase